jgi:hypothetical protein
VPLKRAREFTYRRSKRVEKILGPKGGEPLDGNSGSRRICIRRHHSRASTSQTGRLLVMLGALAAMFALLSYFA